MANIPALERDLQTVKHEPVVLAARLVASGPEEPHELYVVERVKRGVYAVCALGNWVEEGDLVDASEACQRDQKQNTISASEGLSTNCRAEKNNRSNWLETARIEDKLVDGRDSPAQKRTKVAVVFGPRDNQFAMKDVEENEHTPTADDPDKSIEPCDLKSNEEPAHGSNMPLAESCVVPCEQPTFLANGDMLQTPDSHSKGEQSQQEVLDGLRKQYLEALYISKVSVEAFLLYIGSVISHLC